MEELLQIPRRFFETVDEDGNGEVDSEEFIRTFMIEDEKRFVFRDEERFVFR